jgi:hypothetical protein
VENEESFAEMFVQSVFQLSAEGDFRYKVQDVSAFGEGLKGGLYIYFSLAGACDAVEQDGLVLAECVLDFFVSLALGFVEEDVLGGLEGVAVRR